MQFEWIKRNITLHISIRKKTNILDKESRPQLCVAIVAVTTRKPVTVLRNLKNIDPVERQFIFAKVFGVHTLTKASQPNSS